MTQTIYMPVLIVSPTTNEPFIFHLIEEMKKFETPPGVIISKVSAGYDCVIQYTFDRVIQSNGEEVKYPPFEYEMENLLYIEVETPESILYQKLDWLEDQIKNVVKNSDVSTGFYYSYLTSETEFQLGNACKLFTEDGVNFYIDDDSDDFSELQKMAPFLNHGFYPEGRISISEAYPDLTAKLILLYG